MPKMGQNWKVQIVGAGTVGKAQEFLIKQLGYTVTVYDPFVLPESKLQQNVDITFICTPEDAVEDVTANLCSLQVEGLYVIKSTVPVGTTKALMKKYNVHICHNPEFLREKHALKDVLNPDRIVIGECCRGHGRILKKLYLPLNQPIYVTDTQTSELIKLVTNNLRAVSISFWNELFTLCQKTGADVKTIAKVADPAKVLGEWEGGKWGTRFFGKPYGGKCLPKDVSLLIQCFRSYGLNPTILEAAEKINRRLSRHAR